MTESAAADTGRAPSTPEPLPSAPNPVSIVSKEEEMSHEQVADELFVTQEEEVVVLDSTYLDVSKQWQELRIR